ncbi:MULTISPECIES: DUF2270 domain-containing protein [Syntrophotalea]|jgi:uncharacterized membrane protein|uniref:Permease n=1 Tax=Syntrophotalea acetylenica TaxID=29542 RepID=A0A1L3GFN0_SYNAC|nr:DUF2270 domain-containing protein [Syntrophotalea acetylenica]APG24649.1 permease [Syntrophotalea acetylenica]APG42697.1 permease [Syntrophotalea acetylenica]APG45233.1 permease [Syntrophotalea acetylenica]MDY0262192.1 DUF2270 domain-containing protein [Syntrophotalea acetylenica]
MPDTIRDDQSLSRAETITAVIHYYRAESARALAWRERLDRTTNWAVAATAAFLGFVFSHPEITHAAFVFGLVMVYILLFVEARRFRFYDAYEYRVRLLHQEFVARLLKGRLDFSAEAQWRIDLAEDLLHPRYKMGALQAIGQRVHANYIYLFAVLLGGWLLKIKLHPLIARSWDQYLEQASVGGLPGFWSLLFMAVFVLHLFYLRHVGQRAKGGRDLIYPRQGG